MFLVKVPGKIMLAGEWSVLEFGNSCIATTIDKFVIVELKPAEKIIFNAIDVGLQDVFCHWDGRQLVIDCDITEYFWERFKFCFFSTQVSLQFLQQQNDKIFGFDITIRSDLSKVDGDFSKFTKFGFGSSAATTVAVCKAILKLHGYDVDSDSNCEIIFKLAYVAHYIACEKVGSGFDIATSAFGSTVIYRCLDFSFLESVIKNNVSIIEIVSQPWPGLYIERLVLPEDMLIRVSFCGVSASTTEMIKKMYEFKSENLSCYKSILKEINFVVMDLISAIKQNEKNKILELIRQNRILLQELASKSGVELEIPISEQMINQAVVFGAAAKISGAGGGDCVIAVCFDDNVDQCVQNAWPESLLVRENCNENC